MTSADHPAPNKAAPAGRVRSFARTLGLGIPGREGELLNACTVERLADEIAANAELGQVAAGNLSSFLAEQGLLPMYGMPTTRQSSLEPHLPLLDAQWTAGCHNGTELWRCLKTHGFRGSLRVVSEWRTRRRRAETVTDQQLQRVPSARIIARLMTTGRDHLSRADTVTMAAIEGGVPTLFQARTLLDRFHAMVQRKSPDLDGWIADAVTSLIASFAAGIRNNRAAVVAAIASPWSNGQTEGQITKLKLVKRQMSGQAKIDLLEARLLRAHEHHH